MAEWSNAPVLKTGVPQGTGGSNPSFSALSPVILYRAFLINFTSMIKFLITGGTFDKSYNHVNGELFFKKTHLPEMIKRSKCNLKISFETITMKDSLDLTKEDIYYIVNACKKTRYNKIIITHGTDTITKTAELIAKENLKNKTIILTGAMIPYAFGSSSDGFFNLGCALSFVQTLNPGVYITMQGEYFNWNEVKKNKKFGFFERIN